MLRRAAVLLCCAAAAGGCAAEAQLPASERHRAADVVTHYPVDRSLDEHGTVRAYVEALDRRDGKRFCGVMAPWISGGYDLVMGDPDSIMRSLGDCAGFVSAYIGYIEDCCPPKFLHARVIALGPPASEAGLRRVDAEIELELEEEGTRRTERLRDRIWLVRADGAWRVAKLSAVAARASIGSVHHGDDPPEAAPDVAADRRRFERDEAAFDRRMREREASFRQPGRPSGCSGGTTIADPAGDLVHNSNPTPGPPPAAPAADLRRVTVARAGDGLCVRFEVEAEPGAGTALRFVLRTLDQSYFNEWTLDFRSDGAVRVLSGKDEADRPIAVDGAVGRDGTTVTLALKPEDLRAGRTPGPTIPAPRLDRFAFAASGVQLLDRRRSVRDDLGTTGAPAFFAHPGGAACEGDCSSAG
jgi:hypothetical protein